MLWNVYFLYNCVTGKLWWYVLSTHRLADLKDKANNNLIGLELSKKQLLQLHLLEEEEKWIREHLELAKSEEFPTSLTEASTLINQHKVRRYGKRSTLPNLYHPLFFI